MNQVVDEKVAAKILGVKVRTMQQWRFLGKGPAYIKYSARAIRYRPEDLEDYKVSNRIDPQEAA